MSKPRPKDMRVGKPEPYAAGKDFDDWDFYVQRIHWYTRSGLSNSAESRETVADSGDSNATTRTAVCDEDRKETTVSKLTDSAWCTVHATRRAARDYSCKL